MGYEIDEAEIAYWGRCPDCLASSGPSDARPAHTKTPPVRLRADKAHTTHVAARSRTTQKTSRKK
jgi:hypothetical protein